MPCHFLWDVVCDVLGIVMESSLSMLYVLGNVMESSLFVLYVLGNVLESSLLMLYVLDNVMESSLFVLYVLGNVIESSLFVLYVLGNVMESSLLMLSSLALLYFSLAEMNTYAQPDGDLPSTQNRWLECSKLNVNVMQCWHFYCNFLITFSYYISFVNLQL